MHHTVVAINLPIRILLDNKRHNTVQVSPEENQEQNDRNVGLSTTGSFENQHYSKDIYTYCCLKLHTIVFPQLQILLKMHVVPTQITDNVFFKLKLVLEFSLFPSDSHGLHQHFHTYLLVHMVDNTKP